MAFQRNRILLDPASGGGGGTPAAPSGGSPAPSAGSGAPAPSPAPSQASAPAAHAAAPSGGPSSVPPATPVPAGAPSSSSPSGAGGPSRLIEGLPARGSQEYWNAFQALPPEKRSQIESEWVAVDNGEKEAPKPGETKTPEQTAAEAAMQAPLPGDAPAAGDQPAITEEQLAALPPEAQAVIQAMQRNLDEVSPMLDPDFQAGLERLTSDPLIKARLEVLASGKDPYTLGKLESEFNPESYIGADAFKDLDPVSDPVGFNSKLAEIARAAFTDGAKKGQFSQELKMRQEIAFTEVKNKIENGFGDLAKAKPELQSKDPSVTSLWDDKHPANPLMKWVAKNYKDSFFLNNPNAFDAAYVSFLASGGKLNDALQSHVKRENLKFILKTQEGLKRAATVGRNTSSIPNDQTSVIPGVDPERYKRDESYARETYNRADVVTRKKLEALRYGHPQPA